MFVRLRLAEDASLSEASTEGLERAGHPVAWIDLPDLLALGGQFFLWELATAVAGQLLHINPFDQPNVEAAKRLARRMVDRYEETGSLPESPEEKPSADAVARFLDGASAGAYAALQAYIPPTREAREALGSLRRAIHDSHLLATTAGFGPRYLHSTGQLHKGDGGRGLFIQFKSDPQQDLPIPDDVSSSKASITFGTLIAAQAAGDRHALIDAGRRVLTLRLAPGDEAEQIDWLAEGLS